MNTPDPDAILRSLTRAEKAAQVLVTAFPGRTEADFEAAVAGRRTQGPASAVAADWAVPPGGVILYGPNIAPPPATSGRLQALIAALQRRALAANPRLGLLVSIDHEGGRFTHLRSVHGFTDFPGSMALGAIRDAARAGAAARAAAVAMARELAWVGVNFNYAPVLDVNNNPGNPIIGERSFGENPGAVAALGVEACLGFAEGGVIACGKHFPGHGDTGVDSHLDLPTVSHPMGRLRDVELAPFVRAIRAGVPCIMTAHVVFPAAAPDGLPATLSAPVLSGLLRRDLGFDGAIVTDALEMRAISGRWGVGEAAVLTLVAGADIALVGTPGAAGVAREAIVAALDSGRLPEARLDEAVRRVLALKAGAGLLEPAGGLGRPGSAAGGAGPGAGGAGSGAGDPPSRYPDFDAAEHRRLAESIAAKSVTLVRDLVGLLPLDPATPDMWAVVSPVAGLAEALARLHPQTSELRYAPGASAPPVDAPPLGDPSFLSEVRAAATSAGVVVVATRVTGGVTPNSPPTPHQREVARLLEILLDTGRPLVWVALGTPYDLALVPRAPVYLATYSTRQPSLDALAAILTGRARPAGTLPVSIPGHYHAGHGLETFGQNG